MEVSENQLLESYSQKDTDELLDLYRAGGLTDIAKDAMATILDNRGICFETESEIIDSEKIIEIQKHKTETIDSTIKNSTTALIVISFLQIITSLASSFYLGVLFGVLLSCFAIAVKISKSEGASLVIAGLGGMASVFNFVGPLVIAAQFGNLVLSLITLWLGIKLMKTCKNLSKNIII